MISSILLGREITYYHLASTSRDLDTGNTYSNFTTQAVKRALIGTEKVSKTQEVAGLFRSFIVTRLDFPPNIEDIVYCDSKYYVVQSVTHNGKQYLITTVAVSTSEAPTLGSGTTHVTGTTAATVSVGNLVFQNLTEISLADQTVYATPAVGVAVAVSGNVVTQCSNCVLQGVEILGERKNDCSTIYLGVEGKSTFNIPATGLIQEVGYATVANSDGTYDVCYNISANVRVA